ncbi:MULTISPECIES: cold-shock protein [Halocynthiibacter]|uniref:Cold shock domain-containing protein n=1 Tax=Halocynthiibacter halioticoli TaxID=2986804 RepID=A0AAE3LR64_9RHOB|nr:MULTISPECIES: cold shock domain-containing protein [Halocynthiibacter]MCV6824189.1 cold shock domain-containing protein [Halocynthiibacter halioticoli]MCW4057190.1 cold shock domain-containing protein [Halocynthiibacter sp. SDUM655004]MDE0589782.1 cold shock domain-containing protein [Halocynthiibacter sp. C4]
MTEENAQGPIVLGQVKWFDPVKGFGFVIPPEGGPDILLHANVLRNFGQGSVAEGSGIEIRVQESTRGLQAVEVLQISPPTPAKPDEEPSNDFAPFGDDSHVPLVPARVKWFDKTKGFGFANTFGSAEDVFVHVEVLRLAGLADLQPGEAIAMRVVDGKRGRMASSVTPWDATFTDQG